MQKLKKWEIGTTEAAKILGVHPCRVRQYIEAGDLRSRLVHPRCRVVRVLDVERLRDRLTRDPRANIYRVPWK